MWPSEGEHPLSCGVAVAVARQTAELETDIAGECKLDEDLGRIWVVAVALFAHSVEAQKVVLEVQRWG